MKNDPQIHVSIGDGRHKDGTCRDKNPNTFNGPDSPEQAIIFIEEKFQVSWERYHQLKAQRRERLRSQATRETTVKGDGAEA